MSRFRLLASTLAVFAAPFVAQPACADPTAPTLAPPIAINADLTFKPLLDTRLRWEDVQQPVKNLHADAVTLRTRAGFEIADTPAHLSFLAEAEGNLGLDNDYDAFNYKNTGSNQYRTRYSVVADPQNVALNRLQLQYKTRDAALTVGRQRINLDDERWVGSVAWRQNEQTFDAVRGQAALGPVSADVTYSDSQRTVFGNDGGPRVGLDGRFWFLGAAVKTGPFSTKGFAYLLDYDNDLGSPQTLRGQTNSSQTYGFRSTGHFAMFPHIALDLAGSYARQSNYKDNPLHYAASYIAGEGDLTTYDFTFKGGYELLGADAHATGGAWSLQTPMATLHKFDGWADVFLTTPANGLADTYAGVAYRFKTVTAIPGLVAQVTYHQFDSDIASINYGHEWDGSIGFKTGPVAWLVKYADYVARGGGTTDTRKFWLQSELSF